MKWKIQISLTGKYADVMKEVMQYQKASLNLSVEDDIYYVLSDDKEAVDASIIVKVEENVEDSPVEPAPEKILSITPRQARLALLGLPASDKPKNTDGTDRTMYDQVNEAVVSSGKGAIVEWEYAVEVLRDSPLIMVFAVQLGLNEEQIDNLFLMASRL